MRAGKKERWEKRVRKMAKKIVSIFLSMIRW